MIRKKFCLAGIALLLSVLAVHAVPAKPGVKKVVKTADGTNVEVELRGDEHFSYYKAGDGRCFTIDAMGVARHISGEQVEKEWNERRTTRLNVIRPASASAFRRVGSASSVTTGKQRGLVILMEFQDVKFAVDSPKETYNRFFNETGYAVDGMSGSVRDYFLEQSYSQLEIDFDIAGPYTTRQNMEAYGAPVKENGKVLQHDCAPDLMVAEAVDAAHNDGVDFRNYDWNNDGLVDQVFVIYAGYAEAQGADENTIWPHEYALMNTLTRTYDGKQIYTYGCSSELMGNGKSGSVVMDGIGTACHEFSHCLGLPDMYDTSDEGDNYAMANWDVMCSGSYNANSRIPAGYTAYERWFSNWMEPVEIKEMTRVNGMKPLAEAPEAYILYNEANRNEYYLLENRQPVGSDAGLNGHGLLIVHVDYDSYAWQQNRLNNVADHQRMTVIPADNDFNYIGRNIAGDTWPGTTGNTMLTNFTTPAATLYNANKDGQKLMSKNIDNITENETAHTVSFVACRPELAFPNPVEAVANQETSSFTIQWPAVSGAVGYEIELTSMKTGAATPEDGLQREVDFSQCYSKTAGFTDIGSNLGKYGLSGWTGTKLYLSPNLLKIGTSTTVGSLKSPTWRVPESGNITVVMGAKVVKAGKAVKGTMTITYGNQGEPVSTALTQTVEFEVTDDDKLVLHFNDVRKDLYWLTINPEDQMYLNYLAVYDGIWSEEQLGIGAASSRRATAVVETYTTTANSYTFQNMSRDNRYAFRVRALGEENTVSKWSDEGTFEFGTAGISPVSVSDADAPVRYYDMQGRKVDASSRGILIRRQGNDVRKVIVKD